MIALTTIGLGVAGYLTYVHYSGATPVCSLKGNPCSQVQKSQYSELAGVPVALMGLIGYIADPRLAAGPRRRAGQVRDDGLTLGGFGFSAYLTYRELFTLHKICEWCVSSAVIMTVLMCLAIWRFLRGDRPPSRAPPRPDGDRRARPCRPLPSAPALLSTGTPLILTAADRSAGAGDRHSRAACERDPPRALVNPSSARALRRG
jgi:uncharacterized membrane protein